MSPSLCPGIRPLPTRAPSRATAAIQPRRVLQCKKMIPTPPSARQIFPAGFLRQRQGERGGEEGVHGKEKKKGGKKRKEKTHLTYWLMHMHDRVNHQQPTNPTRWLLMSRPLSVSTFSWLPYLFYSSRERSRSIRRYINSRAACMHAASSWPIGHGQCHASIQRLIHLSSPLTIYTRVIK